MRYWVLLCSFLLSASCAKNPTEPVADLTPYIGTYVGTYVEYQCGIPLVPEFSSDSVQAAVMIEEKNFLRIHLMDKQDQLLWELSARYENDSTFFIPPFTAGAATLAGTAWWFTDSLVVALGDRLQPCLLQGDTAATFLYRGIR